MYSGAFILGLFPLTILIIVSCWCYQGRDNPYNLRVFHRCSSRDQIKNFFNLSLALSIGTIFSFFNIHFNLEVLFILVLTPIITVLSFIFSRQFYFLQRLYEAESEVKKKE